jgi:hypothetical protein
MSRHPSSFLGQLKFTMFEIGADSVDPAAPHVAHGRSP